MWIESERNMPTVTQEADKIILDFKKVDFVDNSTIGFILKYCRNNQVIIRNASKQVGRVISISGLKNNIIIEN